MSRGSKGFSLLEVMVALAISALMIALVAASFAATHRGHRRAMEHLELNQTVNETMARIRKLLQAAYLTPHIQNTVYTPFETMDMDNMAEPYDAITFTTVAYSTYKIDAKQADLAEVTLFTEKEPPMKTEEGEVRLHRLRVRVGGEINDRFEVEGGVVYTLADHVTKFLIEFLDPAGEWRPEWVPIDRGWKLPCAARITLGVRSEGIEEIEAIEMIPFQMSHHRCSFDDERVFRDEGMF